MRDPDFLCFGLPKSGTTMLQRMLDMHPQVSCPHEQDFIYLARMMAAVKTGYNDILAKVDALTGAQGARPYSDALWMGVLRDALCRMAREAAGEKPIAGLSDNGVAQTLGLFSGLLPGAKLILVVRHPLDRALSSWAHNHRMAARQGNRDHLKPMEKAGGLGGWIELSARRFVEHLEDAQKLNLGTRLLILRYEQVIADRRAALQRIYAHVGARADAALLDDLTVRSGRAAMKATSGDPEFYGSGKAPAAPDGAAERVERIAGETLARVGYRTPAMAAKGE